MERVDPYPLIWAAETMSPTSLIKLAYLPSAAVNGAVGLPMPVLMKNPGIRGHDLCFDKTCQGNRLAKCAKVGQ